MKGHRRHVVLLLIGAGGLIALGAVAGTTVLLSGALSTDATKQHYRLTHRILDLGLEYSVRAASDSVIPPDLDRPYMRLRGAACFREHCIDCHGAPGVAPQSFALGMLPVPGNLAHAASVHPPEWLYHVTRKGVRMTGMPAWEFRLSEESLWSLVSFLESLPGLDAQGYLAVEAAATEATCEPSDQLPARVAGGEVLLRQYGCHSCHRIEGVVGPRVDTGPALVDWPRRGYIAGVLPNTEENLTQWIQHPTRISPQTLMPELGVPPAHARAMARFLLTPR